MPRKIIDPVESKKRELERKNKDYHDPKHYAVRRWRENESKRKKRNS